MYLLKCYNVVLKIVFRYVQKCPQLVACGFMKQHKVCSNSYTQLQHHKQVRNTDIKGHQKNCLPYSTPQVDKNQSPNANYDPINSLFILRLKMTFITIEHALHYMYMPF